MTPEPPRLPDDPYSLDRAISLLGSRAQNPLNEETADELLRLIGAYPDARQARVWKTFLKKQRKLRRQNRTD